MGCDIHVFVEVQQEIKGETKWVSADHFMPNPYHEVFDGEGKWSHQPIYRTRNYELFSALTGGIVRGYSSKVGMLEEPKGLPEDTSPITRSESDDWDCDGHSSPITRSESDDWDCDGHSHSWFTLQDLYEYQDKHSQVTHLGYVSPESAKALDETGEAPKTWCQGTSDQTWVHREWTVDYDLMGDLIKSLEDRARDVHWIFEKDQRVSEELAVKTRIVFWFDN